MTIKKLETAMPQLIPQDQLNMKYVMEWKASTEKALRIGRGVTKHTLEDRTFPVYHWAKSSVSGVWFISLDGENVDYLYSYQSLLLGGNHKASEALAYLFNTDVRGVTRAVFFNHLLPQQKFVVTDFIYTPDGHRWFQAEYNDAFGRGYKVYAIKLLANKHPTVELITEEQFRELKGEYWGKSKAHQKYRFAIELP